MTYTVSIGTLNPTQLQPVKIVPKMTYYVLSGTLSFYTTTTTTARLNRLLLLLLLQWVDANEAVS